MSTFFTSKLDWLDVWDVCNIDVEKINARYEAAKKECDVVPFRLRVSTDGAEHDHKVDRCDGGVLIDILSSFVLSSEDEVPLLTIRIPWKAAKLMGDFLRWLPAKDPMRDD